MNRIIPLLLSLLCLCPPSYGAGQNLSTRINIGLANGLTTLYKNAAFNALAGYNYQADTTSTAFTATLPNGSQNAQTQFVDDQGTWGINNLTICPNGSQTIQGITAGSCLVANLSGAFVQLTWDNTNSFWTVTANGFNYDAIASATQQGIVSTTTQTFAGNKTFNGTITPAAGIVASQSAPSATSVGHVYTMNTTVLLTNTVGGITSITVPAGSYMISGTVQYSGTTANNFVEADLTSTSGGTGTVPVSRVLSPIVANGSNYLGTAVITPYEVNPIISTTYWISGGVSTTNQGSATSSAFITAVSK